MLLQSETLENLGVIFVPFSKSPDLLVLTKKSTYDTQKKKNRRANADLGSAHA